MQPHVDHEKNALYHLRTDCVVSWVKQNVIYRDQVQTREVTQQHLRSCPPKFRAAELMCWMKHYEIYHCQVMTREVL